MKSAESKRERYVTGGYLERPLALLMIRGTLYLYAIEALRGTYGVAIIPIVMVLEIRM